MKKIAFLLFSAFTISFASQAQIGVKLGANLSNLSGDLQNEDFNQNKLGFVGGLSYNIPLSSDDFISVQPELLYSQKGFKYADYKFVQNGMNYTREGKLNYNYLDLPILLKINAGGFFFEGGPQVSYLLGIQDKTEVTGPTGIDTEASRKINKDGMAKLEIGYAAGLGYMTPFGFSIGLRYNGSINALAKDNTDELANARNSLYQATIGFKLPTGSR